MERKLTKLEHSHVSVDVVVDEATWKKAQDDAYNKLAEKVQIDGFRKGKAPLELAKKRVDPAKALDEAINSILPKAYEEIIKEDHVSPVAQPKVDVTKISDKELEIKFVIAVRPEIKVGKYKDLKIGHEEVKVTAKDVDEAIENTLKASATLVLKEGEAKLGDTVVMDFVGLVDGLPFDGGSAENYELELGSHSFIPGFEEQLVGAKEGQHVDVKVKFPENYVENLKGKDAVFGCDIHEVKEKKLPALDDEFVKEAKINGVETVEQYKEYRKNELVKNKEREERNRYMNKLLDELIKTSDVDLPEEIILNQVEDNKKDMENRMKQSGLTIEQYLQLVGQTQEQFEAQLKENVEKDAKRYFLMNQIALDEDLLVSDEELELEYAKIADQYNMKIDDVKKALAAQEGQFRDNIKMNRVEDLLFENNN